jgi:hypothetical protein
MSPAVASYLLFLAAAAQYLDPEKNEKKNDLITNEYFAQRNIIKSLQCI